MIDMPGDTMIIEGDDSIDVPVFNILFDNFPNQDRVPPDMGVVL